MIFKVLLVMFQLSASVPNLLGQITYPSNNYPFDGSYWGASDDASAFPLNSPQSFRSVYPDVDQTQEASYSAPVQGGNFGREFLNDQFYGYPQKEFSERQFPFFGPTNPIFPNFPQQQQFPAAPFFGFPQITPWWQGDNVCVTTDESTTEWTGNEVGVGAQPDFSINLQTCAEQKNQYVCKTITNRGGKKLTITKLRQCCKGYARFPQRNGPNAGCVKVEMVSFAEAAEKYGYSDFSVILKAANISQEKIEQATLLLPMKMEKSEKKTQNETEAVDEEIMDNLIEDNEIVEYIIANRTIDMEEVENEEVVNSEGGHGIRFNVYPKATRNASEYKYQYTANCVPVIRPKIFSTEGMVIGLEKKLPIAESNLLELINDREDLSMFSQMVENFNLSRVIAEQDGITVLAPQDEAFKNMSDVEQRMLISGDECAAEYLTKHILGLTLCSSAVVKNARAHVQSLAKDTVALERNDDDEIYINQRSKIIQRDLVATNGVMHVVDQILPSEAFMTVMSLLKQQNSTIFSELLTKSGFADQFEDLRGVTMFVPSDRALKNSPWKEVLDNNPEKLTKNLTLYEFLSNHVVNSVIGSHEFRTAFVKTMAKNDLKMNLLLNHPNREATLNCAKFIATDGVSCNRAVHQIDRPLEIPTKSISETLESEEKYSTFLGIIKQANLTHLISNETRDITLLVPTNDVFEEQKEYYENLLSSSKSLEYFVKMHMVLNSVCCSSFPKYPEINTVQTASGVSLVVTKQRRPLIGNAHIKKCDILAKNGVIFEVNDIIEMKAAPLQSNYFNY